MITLFALSPLANAFAQISDASGTATSDLMTATSGAALPATDTSSSGAPTNGAPAPITPPTKPQILGASSPSGNTISPSEQPVAFTSFGPNIDKNTGAFTYTYPIDIPPGRNGLQPDLNLNYSSQDAQLNSIFGEGWSASIPYIERLNKTGADQLYSTTTVNYFISSLDGELVASTTPATTTSTVKVFQLDTGGTLTTNLVSYWNMEGNSNDFYSTNNGTDTSVTYSTSTGKVNQGGGYMSSTTSYTSFGNDPWARVMGAFSVSLWIKFSSLPVGNAYVIGKWNEVGNNRSYLMYVSSNGAVNVNTSSNGTNGLGGGTASGTIAVGTWYHLVMTNDQGGHINLYVNGTVSAFTGSKVFDSGTNSTLTMGGNGGQTIGGSTSAYCDAAIDEVGFWTKALSAREVTDLYNSGNGQTMVSTTTVTTTYPPVASSYVARTERGSFNRYTFSSSTNQWTLTDKNGVQYTFGSTSDSRQSDPANASDTFKWMLKQVTDTNGNTVAYNYVSDSGQIYPSSTIYTGTATSTGIFEIDFLKQSRSDTATSSATGFPVSSQYRINEIDAKVNGSWVRKYTLGYTAGDNASTSLLSTITESGENASGTAITLPTSTFTYQLQTPGWTVSSTWTPPVAFLDYHNNNANGVRVADVNGDGLAGLLQGVNDNPNASDTFRAWVDNGHGWTSSSTWSPPASLLDWKNNSNNGVDIVDVNGDGLPDVVQAIVDNPNAADFYETWINTGSGWVVSSTWNLPAGLLDWYSGTDAGTRIVDLNGDGLPDVLQGVTDHPNASDTYQAWINNGHGWTQSAAWAPPVAFLDWLNQRDTGWRIADLNGDGLPDLVSGSDAYINNGHGWTHDPSYASPLSFWDNTNENDNGVRIADVNGDGLPDILQGVGDNPNVPSGTIAAYINTGHGWTNTPAWIPPVTFLDWTHDTGNGVQIADVTGDGLPGILQGSTDNPPASDTYTGWVNDNAIRANLLTGFTYPQGGSSTIQYSAAAQVTDGSGNIVNYAPYPIYVVTQKTTNDGAGNLSTTTYQYSGGTYYYGGPNDKQFAGFGKVTETDSAGNVTKTYYDTGNGNSTSTGQYQDDFWKIGKAYRVENYDNASNLYKTVITKWDSASLVNNSAFVFPDQKLEMDYDGLSTHADLAEAYAFSTSTGNETQKIQYGQVVGGNDGTFTTIATSTSQLTTNYSYASSTASNIIGKISDETLVNQSSTKIQETQYYYDNLGLGNVSSTGNLTKQSDWETSSTYASSQNTYNGYGLVATHLDPRNNTTTYAYDTYNLYPATTTNALNQTTGNQYDYSTGKPMQTVDPNGDTFKTTYDGLGRPLAILQPDPANASNTVTSTVYVYTDTANAVSVHESDYMNATTSVDTYTYYDGLNRVVQTRKSAEDSGNYKVTDRAYNNVGLVQKESLPYFASGSSKTSATTTATLFTNYAYDALKRMLTIGNAVGTTTDSYANWKIKTIDPRGKEKDIYDDAYQNFIQVDEHNGSSTYSTYYAYDGLKDLKNATDSLGNVRAFTYDGLGRRLTAQDLHPSTSTTYGTWNYAYDDANNLTQQVDPKNQTTTLAYDGLNRVTSESFGGQTQISYTYDTCAQGIGRLCVASSSGAVASDTYNGLGAISKEVKTIGTSTYTTSYTSDYQGNQLTITNPDNSVVQYTYNLAGLPETVTYKKSGGSFVNVVTNFDYSPTDQPATISYANNATTTNTYDATKLYRLTQKLSTLPSGGGNAQNLSYVYDAAGNITQIVDTSNSGSGKTVNYAYDDLSRLINASTTNVSTTPSYNQIFAYDALGNTLTGPAGTYSYGATASSTYADPDAATSIATQVVTTTPAVFDASSSLNPSVASTTLTFPLTVTSTANRVLLVGVTAMANTNTSTAATYNGTSMSLLMDNSNVNTRMQVWYLQNPASGTHNVAVTMATSTSNVIPIAVSFANTAGVGATSSLLDQGTSTAVTITSASNNKVLDFLNEIIGSGSNPTPASGQTLLVASTTTGGARQGASGYITATSSAPITERWTLSSTTFWQQYEIEVVSATTTVTSTVPLNYDNDGSLTSQGPSTYTWDYRNRLTQSVTGSGTSTYAYDYLNNRVKLVENGVTTLFPTTYYNAMQGGAATTTKHIFADGLLLATVIDSATTTSNTATLIQQATSTASAGTVLGTTLGSAPRAGDALMLTIGSLPATGTIASITGGGVTWQKAVQSGVNRDAEIWYGLNSSGSGTQVSTTLSTACQGTCMINVSEWSGLVTSSALDATSTRSGSGTTTISPTSTTSNINDLIIATERGDNSSTLLGGPTGAFAALASAVPTVGNGAYDVVHTTVATSTSWTYASVASYDSVIAALKIATTTTPATSTTDYVFDDHLGGTGVVTNASGTVVETLDYYPYGQARMDTKTAPYQGEKRKYIGQEYDGLSGLDYLQARYYDGSRGQFTSEDPSFLAVGDPKQVKLNTNQDQQVFLSDPQQMNVYGYSRDNPITKSDPDGRCPLCATALLGAGGGLVGQFAIDMFHNVRSNGFSVSNYTLSSPQTYLTRAAQGFFVGLSGGVAGGLGIAGQAAVVGITSGVVGAGGNYVLHQPITPQSVVLDTTLGVASFGVAEFAPEVSGRLPNFGTQAFFTGAHTQENALKVGIGAASSYLTSVAIDLSTMSNSSFQGNRNIPSGDKQANSTPSGASTNWIGNKIIHGQ